MYIYIYTHVGIYIYVYIYIYTYICTIMDTIMPVEKDTSLELRNHFRFTPTNPYIFVGALPG